MEPQVFDNVKFEKEKAIARFNRFRRVAKLWQVFEVLLVFGLISWSSARVPAVLKVAGGFFVEFSAYLFNHHVIFLIGNAIIVLLFFLCRRNVDVGNLSGDGDFYDDYLKHSVAAAAHPRETTLPPPPEAVDIPAPDTAHSAAGDEEKQIVVCAEETKVTPQCDDVAAAIEMATKQIKRFQRTQSDKLKREICVRQRPELRRSETENCRQAVCQETEALSAAEIETLSNEEFRRTVDAFIDKHWSRKQRQEEFQSYQLLKMS